MFARSKWLLLQHSPTHFLLILLSSQLVCPSLTTVITLMFSVSSRLANILGLSSRDIPLCLREQFGYAKKNSLIFEAQYDTTGNYKYNVVPVSLSFRIATITLYKLRNNNNFRPLEQKFVWAKKFGQIQWDHRSKALFIILCSIQSPRSLLANAAWSRSFYCYYP